MSEIRYARLWNEPHERRVALCRSFYVDVYRACFPERNEQEDPDVWLPLMSADLPPGKPRVFMILACRHDVDSQDEKIVGGIIFESYPRSGAWLATYIAVRQDERRGGIGKRLFSEMVRAIGELVPGTDWQLYAEAENPIRRVGPQRGETYRRLSILATLGLKCLPFDYVQPALSPDRSELDDLLFLYWPQDRNHDQAPLDATTVARFLTEFYAALDQPGSAALRRMIDQLEAKRHLAPDDLRVPARYDVILGHAEAITIRMTFFAHFMRDLDVKRDRGAHWSELPHDLIRPDGKAGARQIADYALLSESFHSFHNDIVVPFASASNIPIILQCEPFRPIGRCAEGCRAALAIRIVFPACLEMDWEGETRTTRFAAPDETEWELEAKLVDTIAIFESGYIAYSVAIILGKGEDAHPALNASAILALATIAKPAGRLVGRPVEIQTAPGVRKPLNLFLEERLDMIHKSAEQGASTAFSALWVADEDHSHASLRKTIHDSLLRMRFPGPGRKSDKVNTKVSVSVEVIGSDFQDLMLRAAASATAREAPVNAFTLRLAGLAQNVLDFAEQDAAEVNDSLAGGFCLGRELTFAHKDMAIRFSKSSRAFEQMWEDLGGEPYWLLVELIIGHNAKLLLDLNDDTRRDQGQLGLSGLLNRLLILAEDLTSQEAQAHAETQLRRTQIRRIRLAHYVPNLFRYPTETSLYETFTDSKGLRIQRQYFTDLELTMERMMRDVSQTKTAIAEARERDSEKRRLRADESRNNLLVAIGVAQATGVFAGFASVFASIAAIDDKQYLAPLIDEVAKEFDWPVIEHRMSTLPGGVGMPSLAHNEWALIPVLGLVFASISFVGVTALLFLLSRFGGRVALVTAVVAAGAVILAWLLARMIAEPVLDMVVIFSALAALAPLTLYWTWRLRR